MKKKLLVLHFQRIKKRLLLLARMVCLKFKQLISLINRKNLRDTLERSIAYHLIIQLVK